MIRKTRRHLAAAMVCAAALVTAARGREAVAVGAAECLVWEMHTEPGYG